MTPDIAQICPYLLKPPPMAGTALKESQEAAQTVLLSRACNMGQPDPGIYLTEVTTEVGSASAPSTSGTPRNPVSRHIPPPQHVGSKPTPFSVPVLQ